MWGAVNLRSKPPSLEKQEELKKRIEAALAKHDRGEPLSDEEMTIVYWVRYRGGCHACGGSTTAGIKVAVRSPPSAREGSASGNAG